MSEKMKKIDLKEEIERLIEAQSEFKEAKAWLVGDPCLHCRHPKDCKIPMFLGFEHNVIIGWKKCSYYRRKRKRE